MGEDGGRRRRKVRKEGGLEKRRMKGGMKAAIQKD